jgi:hypothetical protein
MITPEHAAEADEQYTKLGLAPLQRYPVPNPADPDSPLGYEVHVDEFDYTEWLAWRDGRPYGGDLSYRFPGGRPGASSLGTLGTVPADLPDPGVDVTGELETLPEDAQQSAAPTTPVDLLPRSALTTAQVDTMLVPDLRKELEARGLDVSGLRAELRARLKADVAGSAPADSTAGHDEEDDEAEFTVKEIKALRVNEDEGDDFYGRIKALVVWGSDEYRTADVGAGHGGGGLRGGNARVLHPRPAAGVQARPSAWRLPLPSARLQDRPG